VHRRVHLRQQTRQFAACLIDQAAVQGFGETLGPPAARQRIEDGPTPKQAAALTQCQESAKVLTENVHVVLLNDQSITYNDGTIFGHNG
jgi:hypothetical protein